MAVAAVESIVSMNVEMVAEVMWMTRRARSDAQPDKPGPKTRDSVAGETDDALGAGSGAGRLTAS